MRGAEALHILSKKEQQRDRQNKGFLGTHEPLGQGVSKVIGSKLLILTQVV